MEMCITLKLRLITNFSNILLDTLIVFLIAYYRIDSPWGSKSKGNATQIAMTFVSLINVI